MSSAWLEIGQLIVQTQQQNSEMKNHERILQLNSLLSKLLDSLCFQMSVNKKDENCLSLLEIIQWRRKGDISQDELVELYKSWLESKSVFDLFTAKQVEIFPKHELIRNQIAEKSFLNVGQINKALELLNQLYNRLYLERKPANEQLLSQAQRIFSYLDPQGFIHLRLSSMFFLAGAVMVTEKYSIPLNYEAYRVYFNDLRKELAEIDGMASLRAFKNYIFSLSPSRRTALLENILPVLSEVEKQIGGERNGLPNLMEEAFNKWRNFPRFSSGEHRKNWEIYKRVFEENQRVFYDEGANVDYFRNKYGEQFVSCFDIDSNLLRQFNILLKDCLNRYVQVLIKVSHYYGMKNPHAPSHKKKIPSELQQPKLSQRQSVRDKTPTKSTTKKIDFKDRTPTKRIERLNELQIKREFGSAEKSKPKTYNGRQTTPTKSYRGPSGLYQSQANTSQKVAIKNGIDKDSFYNKMFFFRNKRVESYDIVMKRLRGK